MGFLNKLERKFGKFAISNLIYYVLGAYAIGYLLSEVAPEIYIKLIMSPRLVCSGEVWRLFTWIFTIPQELDLWVIFMFFFYAWIGLTLEKCWGTFKYNLYMFSGWFFMTVGAMVIYFISTAVGGWGIGIGVSTHYINLTSFLACATLFPEVQVLLFMVIPVKMKWIAIVDLVLLGYEFVNHLILAVRYDEFVLIMAYGLTKEICITICASIVIALLNFALYFFVFKNGKRFSPKQIKRKSQFKKQVKTGRGISKHKCAICGRTENDGEGLVFRFCSRCEGNYEYCQDHLFTHEHVKNDN